MIIFWYRFSEFLNYILDRDLRYDDEHWAPFFKECTPCHINFTFIGQYMFLDTWEWPVDEDASFTFDRVEDSALLCTCHQATLRLSTGIFTFWQTKLASLNGTTRMWATLIYKTLLDKDSNPATIILLPFSGLLPISNTQKSVRRVLWYSWERHHQKTLSKVGKTVPEDQNFVNHYFFH